MPRYRKTSFLLLVLSGFPFLVCSAFADLAIYSNSLASGWENWSWGSAVNLNSSSPVHAGSAAVSVTYQSAWAGFYLHSTANLESYQYSTLSFWINGRTGGQKVNIVLYDGNGDAVGNGSALTLTANTWQQVNLSIASLGSPAQISGIVLQENNGTSASPFSIDDIVLITSNATPTPTPTPQPAPALAVNASANQHPISPYIYGMNFTDEALANELGLPVRRWGGNATTRYNWQNDTSNRGMDWYFENIPEDNANLGALPNGSSTDRFVEQDRRTATKTILTMPLIGWTPKSRTKAGGFSVAKYGAQQSTDPWLPDAGNGRHANGTPITGNDPADTSMAITPTFVANWINHLKSNYGNAASGGVAFYNLDNEPMLWNDTHRDVHPTPLSYDEIVSRTLLYAPAIKAADPTAKTLGPAEWGWTGYLYSALDSAAGGDWWNHPADRNAHGGIPLVEWYLQKMKDYETQHGTRILDYLDLHFYPQANGVSLSTAGGASTQALRLRSTRSLWDPAYIDESWINEATRMIPRMKEWVNTNYPGTKLAMTEYNWGGLEHINGALAQADVLGIFGREGLDLATLWSPPSAAEPGAFAFRMFLNFDGNKSKFGETSVQATSSDSGRVSIFAARRSAGNALTIMLINKTSSDMDTTVTLAGYAPSSTAAVYRYSAANLNQIVHAANIGATSSGLSATSPANSITLVILSPAQSAAGDWTNFY